MQHLRQLCVAAAFVCALTYTTFAGEMNYPIVPPPPPPDPAAATANESGTSTTSSETAATVTVEGVVGSLLQDLMIIL